jgi:hypothetical protein
LYWRRGSRRGGNFWFVRRVSSSVGGVVVWPGLLVRVDWSVMALERVDFLFFSSFFFFFLLVGLCLFFYHLLLLYISCNTLTDQKKNRIQLILSSSSH